MNSPTITMTKDVAVRKLEEYERAVESNPKAYREMDRGILLGYRVLAKGGRLVDVNEAIKHGGLNVAALPKLAIARAHVETCSFARGGSVLRYYWHHRSHPFGDSRFQGDNYCWRLPASGVFEYEKVSTKDVRAMVPLVPLPLRPRHNLSNYFILWEANWHPEPPRDPYLLRPLTGSLMEIIAEWELTPLEIAAVRGAMQTRGV